MRIALLAALAFGTLAGVGGLSSLKYGSRSSDPGASARPPAQSWADRIAADGVVEGARPEVALRPEIPGILDAIHVRENQDVTRGTLLAELHNATQAQQVALATAELAIARAELAHLHSGERPERRRMMAAAEEGKQAHYLKAKADADRSRALLQKGATTAEEGNRDQLELMQARSEWEAATAERALVEAPPRAEEVSIAEGHVRAAEARLALAEAELAKTRLLAPADGRILRLFAEPGEAAGPDAPTPVLLMADLSRRRVRAFVEELDAARVRVGQPATVTADGLPGEIFTGAVAQVADRMGKRNIQTDEPGEYKDLYFREVLIDLDGGDALPLNLRVQARIEARGPEPER